MELRKVLSSTARAIFYILVWFFCQMIVENIIASAVLFWTVFKGSYSVAGSAADADILALDSFNATVKAAEEALGKVYEENLFLIMTVCAVFTLFVYFIIFRVRKKKFTQSVGIRKMNPGNYPMMLALGISLYFLTVMILSLLPVPENLMKDYAEASSPISENVMAITGIIYTVIITPIFEEIVFRGLVYTRIKRCMPMLGAMILSSFLFGVMHGSSVVWVAYASVLGFFLAWAFEKCGSLLASVTLHMGFNLTGTLTTLLPADTPSAVIWSILVASAVVSVVLILVVNKKSKVKIEIGMPEWETEKD